MSGSRNRSGDRQFFIRMPGAEFLSPSQIESLHTYARAPGRRNHVLPICGETHYSTTASGAG
jgi:hypothetical protein